MGRHKQYARQQGIGERWPMVGAVSKLLGLFQVEGAGMRG